MKLPIALLGGVGPRELSGMDLTINRQVAYRGGVLSVTLLGQATQSLRPFPPRWKLLRADYVLAFSLCPTTRGSCIPGPSLFV